MESTIAIATLFGAIFSAAAAVAELSEPDSNTISSERMVEAFSNSLVIDSFLSMSEEELREFSNRMVRTSRKFRKELTGSEKEDYEKAWEMFSKMRVECAYSGTLFGMDGVRRVIRRYGIEFSLNVIEGSQVDNVFQVHDKETSKVAKVLKWVCATLVGGLMIWAQVKMIQRLKASELKVKEMNNTISGLREENDYLNRLDPKVDFLDYLSGQDLPDLHVSNLVHS